ncbi:hypothetical protein K1719_021556 [Acacia pycnantha]|nr:hypothetical protein K1719_021556 [Acacia pycnantha]
MISPRHRNSSSDLNVSPSLSLYEFPKAVKHKEKNKILLTFCALLPLSLSSRNGKSEGIQATPSFEVFSFTLQLNLVQVFSFTLSTTESPLHCVVLSAARILVFFIQHIRVDLYMIRTKTTRRQLKTK